MHKYKFRAAHIPDCERKHLYVTWCEVHGMVGLSAPTMEELAYTVELAADELTALRANKGLKEEQ